MHSKIKNCKLWFGLTIFLFLLFFVVNEHGSILRLFYGRKIDCKKVRLTLSGNYIFVPAYEKNKNGLITVGNVFCDFCVLGVCFIVDFSEIEKKGVKSNYDYLKKIWIKKGFVYRERKLGKLEFDEWYVYQGNEAGNIVVVFPDYELFFFFSNNSLIDDFLKHVKFEVKGSNRQ